MNAISKHSLVGTLCLTAVGAGAILQRKVLRSSRQKNRKSGPRKQLHVEATLMRRKNAAGETGDRYQDRATLARVRDDE